MWSARGYSRVAMLEQLLITFGWRTRHIWWSEHRGVQEDSGGCGMCAEMSWVLCMQAKHMQHEIKFVKGLSEISWEQMRCTYWITKGFGFFIPSHLEGKLRWVYWKLWISRNWQQKLQPQNLKPRLKLERQRRPRSQSDSSTATFFSIVCSLSSNWVVSSHSILVIWRCFDWTESQQIIAAVTSWGQAKAWSSLWSQLTCDILHGWRHGIHLSDGCESCRPCVGEKPTLEVGQELTLRVIRRTRNSLRLDYKGKEAREWNFGDSMFGLNAGSDAKDGRRDQAM